MKNLIIILSAALFLFSCSEDFDNLSTGQQINYSKADENFLPVSTWYSGGKSRAPMLSTINEYSEDQWRRDIQQIKDLGFNTVRAWVEWAHCEPRPGEYNLQNLELLAKLAQEAGLRFIIQLYVDSAPDWVGEKYPDGKYVAQNGAEVESQAAPGYCSDHGGVRQAVQDFITKTASVAVKYPNFHGWDLWSEPHIVNWAYINYVPNVQFCYCGNTRAKFRNWLKDKYGNLENLNKAWYRNFERWIDVDPPRFGTILSYTDFIDWKNFIYEKLADDLLMRYKAVRRADISHVITSHAAVPSIFYSPYNGYGATDDFLMAGSVDYYGTSLYPKHNHPSRHWEIWKFMGAVDFTRSANKANGGFYVGEMQAGKGTIGLNIGDPITPEDHRVWMWSVIAKGTKAINLYAYYPMSSGYESGGYGLINLDGTPTTRAIEAGKTARIITENMDTFLNSKPVAAKIAIVYNPLAQMVGGEQRHSTSDMHRESLFGYYRFFAEHNIPVDFIHRRDLENRNYQQYKLIIVPYPLMFSETAAAGLAEFVENGGHALAEARLAWNDERGFAATQIPGMGLHKVFGATELSVKMEEEVKISTGQVFHPLLNGLEPGTKLKGAYFAESLKFDSDTEAQVLARFENGDGAIITNNYGTGKTLLLGSFMGMANHPEADPNNNKFFMNLLEWAGIEIPFSSSHDNPVEVRLSQNDKGFVLFVINHGQRPENVEINLNVRSEGRYRLREMISESTAQVSSIGNNLQIKTGVERRDVKVWEITGL